MIGKTNALNKSGGDYVQKTCSSKFLSTYTSISTSGNNVKVCDATYNKSISLNNYNYYYFATITANKMYYNGVDIPEHVLINLGSNNLYYGSTGSTIDSMTINACRDGNILYLTFGSDKNVIKISYSSRSFIPIGTITFSEDVVVSSVTPSLGDLTSYTQVYGTATSTISNYSVVIPKDASSLLNLIQFTYGGSSFTANIVISNLQ